MKENVKNHFTKYKILTIFSILFCCLLYSQNNIPFEKKFFSDDIYLYQLKASINGVKTNLIIDTGASYSSLQDSFIEKLLELNVITLENISPTLQKVYGVLGDEKGLLSIKINNITIQNKTFNDVSFLITKSDKVPNIIGLNILERLEKITLDFQDMELQIK